MIATVKRPLKRRAQQPTTINPQLAGLMVPVGTVAREAPRKSLSILPSSPLLLSLSPYNPKVAKRKKRPLCDTTKSPLADGGVMLNGSAVPFGTVVRVRWGTDVLWGRLVHPRDPSFIVENPIPPLGKGKVRVYFDDGTWGDPKQEHVTVGTVAARKKVML